MSKWASNTLYEVGDVVVNAEGEKVICTGPKPIPVRPLQKWKGVGKRRMPKPR